MARKPPAGRREDSSEPGVSEGGGPSANVSPSKKPAEAGFIVNDAMEVIEFFGHTGPYLDITPGRPSLHLGRLLRSDLFHDVQRSLADARVAGAAVRQAGLQFISGGETRRTDLEITPIPGRSSPPGRWRVVFNETAATVQTPNDTVEDSKAKREAPEPAGIEPQRSQEATADLETTNVELETASAELRVTVSEREAAQKEAEEREREFRLLAENVPELFSYVGPDQRYRFVNKRYEEFYGRPREEIIGKHIRDVLGERTYESARSHVEAALSGRPVSYENQLTSPAHGDRWMHAILLPDKRPDGRTNGFFTLVSDITERKEAERALERENVIRSAILDTMDALVVVLDRQGRIVTFNRAIEKSTGYSFEEVKGRQVWELLEPGERDRVRETFAELIKGTPNRYINHMRTKSGGRRLISWSNTIVSGDSGAVDLVIATGIDITEGRAVQEALGHSEARASALLETAAQAIFAADQEGRIQVVNATAERMFGYKRSEMLGQGIELLIPERFRKRHIEHRTEYVSQPGNRVMGAGLELYGRRKDGTEFPIEVSLSYIEPRDGVTSVAFVSDITDRKLAQDELSRNREQLRALTARLLTAHEQERRVIARNLHDDLTQKVAILGMEIGLLSRELPEQLLEPRRKLDSLGGQIRGLSEDIRKLSHQLHPSALEQAGLEAALRGYCREFAKRHAIQADVTARQVPDDLPSQVGASLYYIAQEALQNAARHSGADSVHLHLSVEDDILRLVIIDNGIGFDQTQARGSENLGLVSMEERARLIGGSFEIQSVPKEGTRVRIEVPLKPA